MTVLKLEGTSDHLLQSLLPKDLGAEGWKHRSCISQALGLINRFLWGWGQWRYEWHELASFHISITRRGIHPWDSEYMTSYLYVAIWEDNFNVPMIVSSRMWGQDGCDSHDSPALPGWTEPPSSKAHSPNLSCVSLRDPKLCRGTRASLQCFISAPPLELPHRLLRLRISDLMQIAVWPVCHTMS